MPEPSSSPPSEEQLAKWYRQTEWLKGYLEGVFGGPVTLTVDWTQEGDAFWERCRIEANQRELFGEVIGKVPQRPAHWRPRKRTATETETPQEPPAKPETPPGTRQASLPL